MFSNALFLQPPIIIGLQNHNDDNITLSYIPKIYMKAAVDMA